MMGIQKDRILALIPARGEPKNLPNKNILACRAKPSAVYSFEPAMKTGNVGRVIVSKESHQANPLGR